MIKTIPKKELEIIFNVLLPITSKFCFVELIFETKEIIKSIKKITFSDDPSILSKHLILLVNLTKYENKGQLR